MLTAFSNCNNDKEDDIIDLNTPDPFYSLTKERFELRGDVKTLDFYHYPKDILYSSDGLKFPVDYEKDLILTQHLQFDSKGRLTNSRLGTAYDPFFLYKKVDPNYLECLKADYKYDDRNRVIETFFVKKLWTNEEIIYERTIVKYDDENNIATLYQYMGNSEDKLEPINKIIFELDKNGKPNLSTNNNIYFHDKVESTALQNVRNYIPNRELETKPTKKKDSKGNVVLSYREEYNKGFSINKDEVVHIYRRIMIHKLSYHDGTTSKEVSDKEIVETPTFIVETLKSSNPSLVGKVKKQETKMYSKVEWDEKNQKPILGNNAYVYSRELKEYDTRGHLTKYEDSGQNIFNYESDDKGRIVKKVSNHISSNAISTSILEYTDNKCIERIYERIKDYDKEDRFIRKLEHQLTKDGFVNSYNWKEYYPSEASAPSKRALAFDESDFNGKQSHSKHHISNKDNRGNSNESFTLYKIYDENGKVATYSIADYTQYNIEYY